MRRAPSREYLLAAVKQPKLAAVLSSADVSNMIHCGVLRPVVFHPRAREALRHFPKGVRNDVGRRLFQLQMGEQLETPTPEIAVARKRLKELLDA